jgi:hypothetical protein
MWLQTSFKKGAGQWPAPRAGRPRANRLNNHRCLDCEHQPNHPYQRHCLGC